MTSICTFPKKISIHASEKEATFGTIEGMCKLKISIHASEKEATVIAAPLTGKKLYFNPRLREGGDKRSS